MNRTAAVVVKRQQKLVPCVAVSRLNHARRVLCVTRHEDQEREEHGAAAARFAKARDEGVVVDVADGEEPVCDASEQQVAHRNRVVGLRQGREAHRVVLVVRDVDAEQVAQQNADVERAAKRVRKDDGARDGALRVVRFFSLREERSGSAIAQPKPKETLPDRRECDAASRTTAGRVTGHASVSRHHAG